MALIVDPNTGKAAYSVDDLSSAGEYNKIHFADTSGEVDWIFEGAKPIYTVAYASTFPFDPLGWSATSYLRSDGGLMINWGMTDSGGAHHTAVWNYDSAGRIISAATYFINGLTGWRHFLLGDDKSLEWFDNTQSNQITVWLYGRAGNIEKILVWVDAAGWVVSDTEASETASVFSTLYVNAAARQVSIYTFNNNGDWIGANTLPY